MPLPAALVQGLTAFAQSEAASIALKKLGQYVWPGSTEKPVNEHGETLKQAISEISERPTRLEMRQAFEEHEERVAALMDIRASATIMAQRKIVAVFIGTQVLTLISVGVLLFR